MDHTDDVHAQASHASHRALQGRAEGWQEGKSLLSIRHAKRNRAALAVGTGAMLPSALAEGSNWAGSGRAYQDVCGSRAVQPAGGFIHEQHRGLGGDLTPDVDALALPAAAGNDKGEQGMHGFIR